MGSVRSSVIAASIAVVLSALGLVDAAVAPAASVPLGGGATKLTLASGFYKGLRQKEIGLRALGSATLKGRRLTLAVSSGAFDSEAGKATFGHEGGVGLGGAGKRVAIKGLRLDPSSKSLSAVVAGRRIRLATLVGPELEREGFDARLEVRVLRLTGAAASSLNRAFGQRALRAGATVGSLETLAEPSEIEPRYGTIAIGGADTTLTKLQAHGVEIGLWGDSEVAGEGVDRTFLFPTGPTRIATDASAGFLESENNGGLTMQSFEGARHEMLLRTPRVDLATGELSATISSLSTEGAVTGTIGTLDFGDATVRSRLRIGAIEMSGIRVIPSQFIFEQLDERLSMPGAFQIGETLARMSINLRAG
jgi:hypothetical protein